MNLFELSDGTVTRQAYFKKITTEDGLKIMSVASGVATGKSEDIHKFVDIAIKYLVLILPESNIEQHLKHLSELDAIFDNPFLSLKIAEEFEKYIAPYLERLNLAQKTKLQ